MPPDIPCIIVLGIIAGAGAGAMPIIAIIPPDMLLPGIPLPDMLLPGIPLPDMLLPGIPFGLLPLPRPIKRNKSNIYLI
jgi:hypothetical protein